MVVVQDSSDKGYKTDKVEDEETMTPIEELDDTSVKREGPNALCKTDDGESDRENILVDKDSFHQGLVIVDELETTHKAYVQADQKAIHKQESEESFHEEMNNEEEQTIVEIVDEPEPTSTDEDLVKEDVLYPDAITPSIKLVLFNIIFPTADIFLDIALVHKLFHNGYLGSGVLVFTGIFTNFLFTSLAWWRLEAAKQKKWSWIFLALQLWPQLRACQVLR